MSTQSEFARLYIEAMLPKWCLKCGEWYLPEPQPVEEPEPVCKFNDNELFLPLPEFACPKIQKQRDERLGPDCRMCRNLTIGFEENNVDEVLFSCHARCPMFADKAE